MNTQTHISDILQLYEFSMAIGKSLDYKKSCDSFLKLVLKRKNLNAAWIIETKEKRLISKYSIPRGKEINIKSSKEIDWLLSTIKSTKLIKYDDRYEDLAPIEIKDGNLAIFTLKDQGFLFLFSKKNNLRTKDLLQLQSVIDTFSINLKACKVFAEQHNLLSNLEIQNQELSDYAHMVSHDLKSPLRSIDGLTMWLHEDYKDKFDDYGKQQLRLIRSNVDKMDTLISGILEYSTIDKNQVDTYDVDINVLIDDTLSVLKIPEHIAIIRKFLPVVKGDRYRLQQLFQNLIDNAINFNDKANGYIEIGALEKDEFWEFYVQDNGKGIENVYFNKIFKTFESLENNLKSTGMGLSIVKKIVHLYEGDIWLTSEPGKGTTFHFTLKK